MVYIQSQGMILPRGFLKSFQNWLHNHQPQSNEYQYIFCCGKISAPSVASNLNLFLPPVLHLDHNTADGRETYYYEHNMEVDGPQNNSFYFVRSIYYQCYFSN